MYNHHLYLLYWFINALVLYLLGWAFPQDVVLTTGRLLPLETAIYAGFWLTFMVWTMWDFIIVRGARLEPASVAWMYFLLVNVLGILVVSKFTTFTGLTVTNLWFLAVIALLTNSLQRMVWDKVIGYRKK